MPHYLRIVAVAVLMALVVCVPVEAQTPEIDALRAPPEPTGGLLDTAERQAVAKLFDSEIEFVRGETKWQIRLETLSST